MAWIYQITNKVNGKKYVGYTKYTPEFRFEKHWQQRNHDTSILHNAMKKYGKKNFSVIGLEEIDESEWVEKEQEWIDKLKTQRPYGYNICAGGNKPPVHFGADNVKSKLSTSQVMELIEDLKKYELDFGQIAKKYRMSRSQIEKINKGEFRHIEGESYPLRKMKKDQYIIQQIIQDLKENKLTQSEIEEKYQIKSRTRLANINLGKVGRKLFPQAKYPIREKGIINRTPLYLSSKNL